jgi:hypothetical protein
MNKRKYERTIRTWLVLEDDAASLFALLHALLNAKRKGKRKALATQSEVVGAIVGAYCLSHRADILESLNAADKATFEKALQRHRVVSGLPRSHTSRGIVPYKPRPRPDVRAAQHPGERGPSPALVPAAKRDAAA